MSPLAWKILSILLEHVQKVHKGEYERCCLAAWTLGTWLGGDACTINGVDVKIAPQNEYQRALRELIDLGIVQEKPDLPERFELIVKHPEKEQPKPVEPTVAEYWKQPPSVQGKIREKVDLDEQLSDL